MYCNECGQALVAGQGYCPRCGRASEMGMPAMSFRPNAPRMFLPMALIERRLNRLAVAWLVYAGLVGLTGLLGLAFAHAFLQGHGGGFGHWYGPGYGHRFWHGPEWPMFAFRFARITLAVKFGLALAAGVGLMQKAYWGRTVAIVAGCLALLSFPLGTAIGIWTLVVLLNAPNAAAYEMMAQ
jgi:hypothetical protein